MYASQLPCPAGQSRKTGWRLYWPAGSGAAAGTSRAGTMIVFAPAWMSSARPGRTYTDMEAPGRGSWRMAAGAHSTMPGRPLIGSSMLPRAAGPSSWPALAAPGGSRLGSASGRRVRDGTVMVRGSWWQRPAGRVVTAALVVVPGPGDTVTFVRQERGPYAGWWLLPGGKVEFGEPVAAGSAAGGGRGVRLRPGGAGADRGL